MLSRSVQWVPQNTGIRCRIQMHGSGKLHILPSNKIPFQVPKQTEQYMLEQYILIESKVDITATLIRFSHENLNMIALVTERVNQVLFRNNGEDQKQIIELLPKSLQKYPLYAELNDANLIRRYWIKESETFTHSLTRQILSRLQIATPKDVDRTFSIPESDPFGRYVARYEFQADSKRLRGTKQRVRYLKVPLGGVQHFDMRISPKGEIRFVLDTAKGLLQLEADLQTIGTVQSRPVFEEQVILHFRAIGQSSLKPSRAGALASFLETEKYRAVEPWDAME